ncbi:hypothetical protein GWG54_10555 [Natronococcus sp. JC468]|uniref:hypothetical protein n=1 Tax=Natronococcus sp. JC468 TaxID=1961921 RepID=UPI001439AA88|nr:hypothetical protein [Natronococcus sp. JC468]NKE36249.1 hypothetical protein [Natronococcus sp. JC468]
MDLTQVGLGLALLAVSSLTFVGPAVLESDLLGYALTGSALVVGTCALFADIARDERV